MPVARLDSTTLPAQSDHLSNPASWATQAIPSAKTSSPANITTSFYGGFGADNSGTGLPPTPVITAGPTYTFGAKDKPAYNPQSAGNQTLGSDNGWEAANALLRLAQEAPLDWNQSVQNQVIAQTIAQHKNDGLFLQQYLGTLGLDRTENALRYASSLDHVQSMFQTGPGTVSPKQANSQNGDIATALSTLVNSKEFSQNDMDRLVAKLANDRQPNSFVQDVIGKASPSVQQMYYSSSKDFALNNLNSAAGQASAANAAQALSYAPPATQFAELQALRQSGYGPVGTVNRLPDFLKAAMQGEAAYGRPSSPTDFALSGTRMAQDGKGQPLTGVAALVSTAANSGQSSLQTEAFQASISTLESDSKVAGFYQQNAQLKEALGTLFQNDYNGLVQNYLGPNGPDNQQNYDLTSDGTNAFQQFFGYALGTPPLASNASDVARFFTGKLTQFANDSGTLSDAAFQAKYNGFTKAQYAALLGDQAHAFSSGLAASLASVKSAADKQANRDVLNAVITVGEATAAATGPEGTVGGALVGEALKLLARGTDGDEAVQNTIDDLKSHGIDVSALNTQNQDVTAQIFNHGHPDDTQVRTNFNDRLNNG